MTSAPATETTDRVAVNGIELHVAEWGDPAGDPVVLLHGWPQHGRTWRHLAPELAGDHRVLAPDLRGFGRSDAPEGRYIKHAFVTDLLALLDAHGIERATLVGHDWGAWTAWLTALEHPHRVERFVSIDVPPPWAEPLNAERLARAVAFSGYQFAIASPLFGRRMVSKPSAIRAFIRAATGPDYEWDDAELDHYALPLTEPARATASVHLYRSFLGLELPRMLRGTYTARRLEVPGLSIMGQRSPILRLLGQPEPEPNLELETIPRAGHYVPEEKPDEVASLVRAFLAGERRSPAPSYS
jgi:pimeloyl-ACP methyl ester carboxylesterase